jgi:activator of HSP90 ATPase
MALPDQADPRWIVNDLGVTGTNVGRWHWQEQNVIAWVKTRSKELLENKSIHKTDDIECTLTTLSHANGDATVSNRKK